MSFRKSSVLGVFKLFFSLIFQLSDQKFNSSPFSLRWRERFGLLVTSWQMLCSASNEMNVSKETSINCSRGVVFFYRMSH